MLAVKNCFPKGLFSPFRRSHAAISCSWTSWPRILARPFTPACTRLADLSTSGFDHSLEDDRKHIQERGQDGPPVKGSGGPDRTVNSAESDSSSASDVVGDTVKEVSDWRKYTCTFEQLDLESDLGNPAVHGRRLVDFSNHRSDPELWEELFFFRQRIHGDEGVRAVWDYFREIDVASAPCIWGRTMKLWQGLESLALRDENVLEQVCDYVHKVHSQRNDRPDGLYRKVMTHFLEKDPYAAIRWHHRLKDFPPNKRELRNFVRDIAKSTRSSGVFRGLCADLSTFQGMYSTVVPSLCHNKLFTEAISWHHFLLQRGDVPESFAAADALLKHLLRTDTKYLARQITQELVDAGVPTPGIRLKTPVDDPFVSLGPMNDVHAEFHNITPKKFTDEFCARLFATRFFSVEKVIRGLQILHVESIGPLSLREITLRAVDGGECQLEAVKDYLAQLEKAEIDIGSSTFSRLVKKLAQQGQQELLHDVVTCDQHPDVFGDRTIQESLLASYLEIGDERQINRTVAILALDGRDELSGTVVRQNILLQSYASNRDRKGILLTLEAMRQNNCVVTPESRKHIWDRMISTRKRGFKPSMAAELTFLINIRRRLMCSGHLTPPYVWLEPLKRLGMLGRLEQYENLAIWLARWYGSADFRNSQLLSTGLKTDWSKFAGINLSNRSPRHPFKRIFNPMMAQGILAWGFQQAYLANPHRKRSLANQENRIRLLSEDPSLWGLRMLVKLRNVGVSFDRTKVRKACTIRLVALFGSGLSARIINRRLQMARQADVDDYAAAMELIWGKRLFHDLGRLDMDLGEYNRRLLWSAELALRFRKVNYKSRDPRLGRRGPLELRSRDPRRARRYAAELEPLPYSKFDEEVQRFPG